MPFGVTLFQNSAIMVTLHGSSNCVQGIEEIILPGINRVIILTDGIPQLGVRSQRTVDS